MNVSGIFAAASAIVNMQVLRHYSIIWKLHHMYTIVQVAQKFSHVNAIYVGTYQRTALSVSMPLLTLLSNFPVQSMTVLLHYFT